MRTTARAGIGRVAIILVLLAAACRVVPDVGSTGQPGPSSPASASPGPSSYEPLPLPSTRDLGSPQPPATVQPIAPP